MKKIKILSICSCLMLLSCLPAHAATATTILIYSDRLSMFLLLTAKNDHEVDIATIPSDIVFPITCANNTPATLSTITDADMQTCMIETVSSALSISVTKYIYLHGKAIEQAYVTTLSMKDIQNLEQLQSYFSAIGEQVHLSVVWKFPQYMNTNLSLSQIYDLYQIYKAEDFSITYHFLHLLQYQYKWYALDRHFYPVL